MRTHAKRKGGFTLIELMIVVAIIGILAAVAIPNFLMFQLRSKMGEAKVNLAAIRTAEEGYFAEYGSYVDAPSHGNLTLSQTKANWGTGNAGFQRLGWAPEGEVFFLYTVVSPAPSRDWAASALSDLDGDANIAAFGYVHPVPGAGNTSAAPPNCGATGVYDASSATFDLIDTVGPCDPFSGQNWF